MTDRTPDLLDLLDLLDLAGRPVDSPKGLRLGWRNTNPDLRSRAGYRWAWPGNWSEAPDDGRDLTKNHRDEACPSDTLGGLCLAKTWYGARSGGIRSSACLIVAYKASDVLGETVDKLRVRRALTLDVIDVEALIRSADLAGADLSRADLNGANLYGANLTWGRGDSWTRLPDGYRVDDTGLIVVTS